MSTQAWTLVGIVVGAVLGGVAQIIAGGVQRSFDRARVVGDFRREAYAHFVHSALVLLQESSRSALYRFLESPELPPTSQGEAPPSLEQLDRVYKQGMPSFDAQIEFQEALAQVEIVAPDDTFIAARAFYKKVVLVSRSLKADDDLSEDQIPDGRDDLTADDAVAEREAFVALAKRDIGLAKGRPV